MSATAVQFMSNLDRANAVRRARSALKHRIKQMDRVEAVAFSADLLMDLPECFDTLPAWEFVSLPSRLHRQVWVRWVSSARVGEMRPLGMLTVRQRGWLAGCMRAYVDGEGSGKTR